MKKITFALFTFIFCQVGFGQIDYSGLQVFAGSTQIDFDTFVHLSQEDKREVMQMLQEHAALTEGTFIRESQKNRVKFKKKTSYFDNPIIQYLINNGPHIVEANSQNLPSVSERELRKDFRDDAGDKGSPHFVRKDEREFLCMYGGWFSTTKHYANSRGTFGNNMCNHPKGDKRTRRKDREGEQNITNFHTDLSEITSEYNEYVSNPQQSFHHLIYDYKSKRLTLKSENADDKIGDVLVITPGDKNHKSCLGTNSIICNPDLFGRGPEGHLYCVQGNSKAINSSALCHEANKAYQLKYPEDYNKMLDNVIAQNMLNPTKRKRFTDSLLTMYDVCMCRGATGYLSIKYGEKIFGDRTCLGLMNQSKRILERISQHQVCSSQFAKVDYIPQVASLYAWSHAAYSRLKLTLPEKYDQYIDWNKDEDKDFNDRRKVDFEIYKERGECPLRVSPVFNISVVENDVVINGDHFKKFKGYIKGITDASKGNTDLEINAPIAEVKFLDEIQGPCNIDSKEPHFFYCKKSYLGDYKIQAITSSKLVDPSLTLSKSENVEQIDAVYGITIAQTGFNDKKTYANYTATVTPNDLPKGSYGIMWEKVPGGKVGENPQVQVDPHQSTAKMFETEYNIRAILIPMVANNPQAVESNQLPVPILGAAVCNLAFDKEKSDISKERYAFSYQVEGPDELSKVKITPKWNPEPIEFDEKTNTAIFNIPNPKIASVSEDETEEKDEEVAQEEDYKRIDKVALEINIEGRSPIKCLGGDVPEAPKPNPPPPKPAPVVVVAPEPKPKPEPEPEPEPKAEPEYTISISLTDTNNASSDIVATIKKDGKEIKLGKDGTTIEWFVQTQGAKGGARQISSTIKNGGIKHLSEEDADEKKEEKEEDAFDVPKGFDQQGNGQENTVRRLTYDRSVFAVLYVDGKDFKKSNSVIVPKLYIPKPIPPNNMQIKRPSPMPPRMPSPIQMGQGKL